MKLDCLFICEGSSDLGLKDKLEQLCVKHGADEAMCIAPDLSSLPKPVGKSVTAQVRAALELEPMVNCVFIHRDSDNTNAEVRQQQVSEEIDSLNLPIDYVCVIPVQETEAWLLTDENEIRNIAENPNGTMKLDLPCLNRIEQQNNPKEILKAAIATASGTTGRRLNKINKRFSQKRRALLERIDIDGPINNLPSWARLNDDIKKLILKLSSG